MSPDEAKQRAAAAALDYVEPGMKLGLGTGSTAARFVALLGEKVAAGLAVVGVPTSEATHKQAAALGIPLTTLEQTPALDLVIDGADEIDGDLALIKGGGGALLREKIVAASAARMLVIADSSKKVARLGAFPLPVEIVPFGFGSTRLRLERACAALGLAGEIAPRRSGEALYLTDGGHFILDCAFGAIPDPERLAARLNAIPGVVEHGLFLGLATVALIAGPDGVETLRR
ncbi:MAG: ribose-5-phosphate isomerase RpiA [Pseudomonadota bacterium]|nr:ribose-5-phosphate isomerase RpiA [Pseudomonadota bacterium]